MKHKLGTPKAPHQNNQLKSAGNNISPSNPNQIRVIAAITGECKVNQKGSGTGKQKETEALESERGKGGKPAARIAAKIGPLTIPNKMP